MALDVRTSVGYMEDDGWRSRGRIKRDRNIIGRNEHDFLSCFRNRFLHWEEAIVFYSTRQKEENVEESSDIADP